MTRREVVLPEQLLDRVDDRLPYTAFSTPDEYIAFVLDQVLRSTEGLAAESERPELADVENLESRLESLGYL